jgi:hypothetical protein
MPIYCVAVAFARLFFPAEARLAKDMANADSTSMYTGLPASKSKGSSGDTREVDLNETPSVQDKRLQLRLQELRKTGIIYCHCQKLQFCFPVKSTVRDSQFRSQAIRFSWCIVFLP